MHRRPVLCSLICFLCAIIIGCAPSAPKREYADVTGTVTWNGEAVTVGTILFQPVSGAAVSAPIDAEGMFQLKGVVGPNKVMVVGMELPEIDPNAPPPETPQTPPPMVKNLLPAKYATPNSPLEFTVESGSNQADFQLEGNPEELVPGGK
jgi:hypothetical protein